MLKSLPNPSCMDPLNGYVLRIREDLQALLSLYAPFGTLCCPAHHPLYPQERRQERNGSLRVLYAARIGHCRSYPLREHCQENGTATLKPRRVSAVFWPVSSCPSVSVEPPSASIQPLLSPTPCPVLWGDWERCQIRRRWLRGIRMRDHDPRSACHFCPIFWLWPGGRCVSPRATWLDCAW